MINSSDKKAKYLLGSEMTEADLRALHWEHSLTLAPEVVAQDLAKMSYIAFLSAQYSSEAAVKYIKDNIIFVLTKK